MLRQAFLSTVEGLGMNGFFEYLYRSPCALAKGGWVVAILSNLIQFIVQRHAENEVSEHDFALAPRRLMPDRFRKVLSELRVGVEQLAREDQA